jgi:hypothetical protein
MRKLISLLVVFSYFCGVAFADNCDWTQIKKLPDGGFEYNPTLNICVGQLVQTNLIQTKQIADLTKAIDLKNLALKYDDDRTALWQKSADDEMSRLSTIESQSKHSDWVSFGLGVLVTIGAAYAASKLIHR